MFNGLITYWELEKEGLSRKRIIVYLVSVPSSELTSPAPSPASECVFPRWNQEGCIKGGGQHSLEGEGAGGANLDDWRESLAFCILCGLSTFRKYADRRTTPYYHPCKLIRRVPCEGRIRFEQGVTKRCRLSWLTNSALVRWAQRRGGGGVAGSQPMSN
jgi:hypothetical protein